ncbi:glutamic acid-rich protein-like [Strongylocentrotus purpuratus]|uniref:DUF6570 domain-containing protein n=1 Tax=Strongylocentrotus purpuratus TaxID=7668 RepID=A0A7M7PDB2_STRPU|nr:glutamic acid-rich protein-like [Strongylocentrotus purpuratus]
MRLAKSMGCPLHTEYEVTSVCAKATSGKNETLKGYPQLQDFVCNPIPSSNTHSESQSGSSGCSIHCESFDEVQILDESVSPQKMIDNPNVFLFPEKANETISHDVHYNGQELKLKSVTITLTKLKEPQLNNSCLLKGNDSMKTEYENEQKGDSKNGTKCENDSDRLNLVTKVQNSNSILSRKRKWSNLESDAKVDVDLGKEIRKCKWVKMNENDSLRIDASKCVDSNDKLIIIGEVHVRNVDPGKKTRKNRQSSNQIRKRSRQRMREKRALTKDEIIKKKEKCIDNAQIRKIKSKNKYQNDLTYKIKKINEVKQRQKENYNTDLSHKIKQGAYVKQRQKEMYKEDSNFRNIQLNIMKTKYHSDLHYKKKILYRNKQKYLINEGFKENVKTVMRTKMKNKYWNEEQFKQMHKSKIRSKYLNNEHFKEKHRNTMKKRIKELYRNDKHFKEKQRDTMKKRIKELYRNDKHFKEKQRDTMKKRIKELYHNNEHFRRMHKDKIRSKYLNNQHFRRMHQDKIRSKYLNNQHFRRMHKDKIKSKYLNNEHFRRMHKDKIRSKYLNDQHFKEKQQDTMKILSKIRYKGKEFKEKKLMSLKMKYKKIEKYRQNVIKQNRKRFALRTVKLSEFDIVLEEFRKIISHGPEYVCCVCLKLLFENQVLKCKKNNYKIQTCISEDYLHVCNLECRSKCLIGQSARSSLWICFTCHRKLKAGKVPPEANMNNLQLHEVPEELANLNNLEQHLIALNIPFMKLMALPKGGQNGVHGPVNLNCIPNAKYKK